MDYYYVGPAKEIEAALTSNCEVFGVKHDIIGALYGEAEITNHNKGETEIVDLGYRAVKTDRPLMNISHEISNLLTEEEAKQAIHDRAAAIAQEYRFFDLKKRIRRPDDKLIKYKETGPFDVFVNFERDGEIHSADLYGKEDNGIEFNAFFDFQGRKFLLHKYLTLEVGGTTLNIEIKEL